TFPLRSRTHLSQYLSFFFNVTATTEIYTLSLHDALPIYLNVAGVSEEVTVSEFLPLAATLAPSQSSLDARSAQSVISPEYIDNRSEEHTSELQSRGHLVCRLLLEKKKSTTTTSSSTMLSC